MVEWLEQLDYDAESRREVVSSRLNSPCDDWKTLSVDPAVNGYLFFEIGKAKTGKREGLAPPFISCAQDTVGL